MTESTAAEAPPDRRAYPRPVPLPADQGDSPPPSSPRSADEVPTVSTRPPSVDALARSLAATGLPHPVLVDVARSVIADGRVDEAMAEAEGRARSLLQPVINGTGVLLHTNLGRAPIEVEQPAMFTNLEFDLDRGRRGSRQRGVGELLATACGAEAAIVVNNCAAAVLLALAALAAGRSAAVSRGELVEIGGGFRIPDVMVQSGARLVEVGTTNRTRLQDFATAEAQNPDLAVLLHVHRSNYDIVGFTESVAIAQLATLQTPVVADIGSGLLDSSCPWLRTPPPPWLADEPAARQSLDAGADLVIFSGDKLFGGPQAGIIAGRREFVERCSRHPLARALRPGGLVLGALQNTTLAYLERRGDDIPFWRMATTPLPDLMARAESILRQVTDSAGPDDRIVVTQTEALPGGGTLPRARIPSVGLRLRGDHNATLRSLDPPLIARVEEGHTVIDLRTIEPDHDDLVSSGLIAILDPPTR